jgi:hypothetical protein
MGWVWGSLNLNLDDGNRNTEKISEKTLPRDKTPYYPSCNKLLNILMKFSYKLIPVVLPYHPLLSYILIFSL